MIIQNRMRFVFSVAQLLVAVGLIHFTLFSVLAEVPLTTAVSRMTADLTYLASDELAGRDVGSPGIALAGEYIVERFKQLGLVTDAFNGGPYQEFTIPGPAIMGASQQNRLRFEGEKGASPLQLEEQFRPVSLGSSGPFEGDVVFAGYGITAPDLNYDDYANLDVQGKVIIVLRKEPRQSDPNSPFDGKQPSQYAFFSSKELNAAVHGAAALILVNDQLTVAQAGADLIPEFTAVGDAINDRQVPTLYCSRAAIDPWLQNSLQTSLQELEAAIDADAAPHSRVLPGVRAVGETLIEMTQTPVRNVVGLLPGEGSLAEEYIVIGAHYDHVGMGGVGSLAPGTIEIHNGADDNASGTTVLLEVARQLSLGRQTSAQGVPGPPSQRRSIIFIAFTGEERGLLGSKYYVRNPRWPLEKTVAMLNMDMVGRMEGKSLTVFGTGTAEQFGSMVNRIGESLGLAIDSQPAGFGPSDHASFYEVSIPVLHFFTGLHNDYHRPSDDYDKVNFEGMAKIADFVADATAEVAQSSQPPTLIQTAAVAQIGRAPRAKRVLLGVRLDNDCRIREVVQGGAAEAAGIKSGDIITAIDEGAVLSTAELYQQLGKRKAGETVTVTVERNGGHLRFSATLQEG